MTSTSTRTRPAGRHHRLPTAALGTLALAAIAACGSTGSTAPAATGSTSDAAPPSTAASTTTATHVTAATPASTTTVTAGPAPTSVDEDLDERVTVGGADVHVRCHGAGTPTVVLISGFGDGSEAWSGVEPAVAGLTRVCTYDRPGTGTSGPAAGTQTFASLAEQLDLVLAEVGEGGPYLVVGHSFGGAIAIRFATGHRDDVTGLVLVDASPLGWANTLCSIADDGTGAAAFIRGMCDGWSDPAANPEHLDVFAAFAELDGLPAGAALGDVPVTVLTAEHRELPADTTEAERTRLDVAWAEGQQRWAALSAETRLITVADTGHYVQLDEPAVVVDEIARLIP